MREIISSLQEIIDNLNNLFIKISQIPLWFLNMMSSQEKYFCILKIVLQKKNY